MTKANRYRVEQVLRENLPAVVTRAVDTTSGVRVILRQSRPSLAADGSIAKLRHDFELSQRVTSPYVAKPVDLVGSGDNLTLVLEDLEARPLDGWLTEGPVPLDTALEWAVQLARAVADIHSAGIVHKAISPASVLCAERGTGLKVFDFGAAMTLERDVGTPQDTPLDTAMLAFTSPEQTGRTNRVIDYRSDYYSLGATLYALFTGKPPFAGDDPLTLVHAHFARTPVAPSTLNSAVPPALSAIILKLLQKAPEDRYQSSQGILYDLERCLSEFRMAGEVEAFEPGERDRVERLHISQKLYGRDVELEALHHTFDLARNGRPALVTVAGHAGIGKTALVRTFEASIQTAQALTASGKFEQFQRDRPYSAIADALGHLVKMLLATPGAHLDAFRSALLDAVGPHGQLLIDLIPDVSLVIGPQPAVTPLSGAEAKARFQRTVRQFLSALASEAQPLMLFLDDLQWADIASLDLVHEILASDGALHVLIVGAYRDHEVDAAHPLTRLLSALTAEGQSPTHLELHPLGGADVDALLRDTLQVRAEARAPLVDLTLERTDGNPFFVIQFVTELWEHGWLRWDADTAAFHCDLDAIKRQIPTANVLAILAQRIASHHDETQQALACASCIGPSFAVSLVARALKRSLHDTARALRPALSAGLLELHRTTAQRFEQLADRSDDTTPTDTTRVSLRFAHDRVEQTAYDALSADARARMHLRIGRLTLASLNERSAAGALFDVVTQFNSGAALIEAREERLTVADLNLRAGRRACASTAYEAADRYLRAGIELLPEDAWEQHYELARDLHLEFARTLYLLTRFTEAHAALDRLVPRLRGFVDEAESYRLRVEIHTTQGRIDAAVQTGIEGAALFGLKLPLHPSDDEVHAAYQALQSALNGREIASLIDLPHMTEPRTRAMLDLLAPTVTASIFFDPKLKYLTLCHMVRLSLEHGNTGASTYAYVYLGSAMGPVFGDYAQGWQFGRLAYDLVDRHGWHDYEAKVGLAFGNMVNFWTRPLEEDLPYLRNAFRAAREYGDLTYSCYCSNHIGMIRLAKGDHLQSVERELGDLIEYVQAAKFDVIADILKSQRQVVRVLRGETRNNVTFSDDTFDEAAFERHLETSMSITICWYYIHKMRARYVFGAYDDALDAASKAEPLIWSSDKTHLEDVDFHFYRFLALAAQRSAMSDDRGAQADQAMDAIEADFTRWAQHAPKNFAHKHSILLGERARLKGDVIAALRAFEEAARSADTFVQDRALAHELAARCALEGSLVTAARSHVEEALHAYESWGADGKVAQIRRQYREHLGRAPRDANTTGAAAHDGLPSEAAKIDQRQLDWLSVIRASQALASETDVDTLVQSALEIMVESAGAQRGVLFTIDDGDEYVRRAQVEPVDTERHEELNSADRSERGVTTSLIRYVGRTREIVLLADAARDPRFALDPHVVATRPKSVLCVPMVRRGNVTGVVYLENNLATALFSEQRISALQVLAAQTRISLDNAELLANLRATAKNLHDKEHFIRRVLDTAPALVYTFDLASGAFAYINPNGAEWLGTTPEALVGDTQAAEILLHPNDRGAMLTHLRSLASASDADVVELEYRVRRADGRWAPVRGFDAVFTRDEHGRAMQIVGVAIDLTSQRNIEEALRQSQKLEAIGRLAGGIAHDFNNHLACISGTAEMLPHLKRREDVEEYTRDILNSVEHGASLIKQLLAFARKSPLERVVFSPNDTIEEVAILLHRTLPQSVKITTTHYNERARVMGDPSSIHTALLNLGINAGDAMPDGGHLSFEVREVDLDEAAASSLRLSVGRYAELIVSDTGTGMDETVLAHIFEPFFTTKSLGEGTGLGLPAVRGTLEQHGGTITVSSGVGQGTTFTILLPLCAH